MIILLVPSPEQFFIDLWLILGVFLRHSLRFLAKGRDSDLCNTSFVKPKILKVQGL